MCLGMTQMEFMPLNELASIFDCMNFAHLPSNATNTNDASFFKKMEMSNLPRLILNGYEDTSAETNKHGRSCVTSFSPEAILNAKFIMRQRRPYKILLDNGDNPESVLNFIKANIKQDEMDFESAPLIMMTKISTTTHIWVSRVFCPDTKGYSKHIWTFDNRNHIWVKNTKGMNSLKCIPNLKVCMMYIKEKQ